MNEAPDVRQPEANRQGGWLLGLILIAIGAVMLIGNFSTLGSEAVVLAIGVVFLVAFALRRLYGFLVPGGILTGLGAGILAQQAAGGNGGPVVLGLGLGFLSIYAIDLATTRATLRWWPLIPGTILGVVGVSLLAQSYALAEQVSRYWPALLVLAGVWLLLTRTRKQA